jgi:hypothetical protein
LGPGLAPENPICRPEITIFFPESNPIKCLIGECGFGVIRQRRRRSLPVAKALRNANLLVLKISLQTRVARFFFVKDTKTGKNVPNEFKMYRKVIKYPRSP